MKKIKQLTSIVALAIGTFLSALPARAQNVGTTPQHYLQIDYIKPVPGKRADYIRMERELWKSIHQARVAAGNIVSWKLYSVSFPNGDSLEYEYVTVTELPSWAALEEPYKGIDAEKILGADKAKDSRTGYATRKMVRRDTVRLDLATDNFSKSANTLLSVHFIKPLPGKANDFMKIQREYFLPMNNAAAEANGGATSWAAALVRYTDHSDQSYSHVSFNGSASFTQMDSAMPADLQSTWNIKFQTYGPLLETSRTKVRNELWRLVDQTVGSVKR